MNPPAPVLAPADRRYRGTITDPGRWSTWTPRTGDILVCTPPKCGTTWTQTILAMLVNGGPDLPGPVPVLSPWIDADLGVPASDVAASLAAQTGRLVVKTHTPADGFPSWEGVSVIAVYRHPLDAFFSLRKHMANTKNADPDHPMLWPLSRAFRHYLEAPADADDFDRDALSTFTMHYDRTLDPARSRHPSRFHYSDMIRDGRRTVQQLAGAAGIDADDDLIDRVAAATAFASMKSRARDYAPVGGTGYWKSDEAFFDSASSGKWAGQLTDDELDLFHARLADLVPDEQARTWLLAGEGSQT